MSVVLPLGGCDISIPEVQGDEPEKPNIFEPLQIQVGAILRQVTCFSLFSGKQRGWGQGERKERRMEGRGGGGRAEMVRMGQAVLGDCRDLLYCHAAACGLAKAGDKAHPATPII